METKALGCCVSTIVLCPKGVPLEPLLAKLPCLGPASSHLTSWLSSYGGFSTLPQVLFRVQLILEILKDEISFRIENFP